MADSTAEDSALPDPAALTEAVTNIAAQSHELIETFLKHHTRRELEKLDPLGLYPAFLELTSELMCDPQLLMQVQFDAWNKHVQIWQEAAQRMMGLNPDPSIKPEPDDRRFRDEDWDSNPFFAYLKDAYLVTAGTIQSLVAGVDGLDEKTALKVQFYTKQFVDAMAPTNFALTNPEVLRTTVATGGQNLLDGLSNFLGDIDRVSGRLQTKMVDDTAFVLGKNVAATPGKVVFQTELMQLIQYEPTTETVYKQPLLIIPPWINKYYILDLQQRNSFIKWAVDQGQTVFVISWVNPDERLCDKDFEDYVFDGPLAALDAIEQATGEKTVNVIGYCIGGTLTGATLAYMAAKDDKRIQSATFFTSLLDFSDPGEIGVFIDEEQLQSLERDMNARGYLDGGSMATAFNMIRANDLIWSFFVNNYLLGKAPLPFDLLYWNSDSTRMPARMHSTYLRKMYLENVFREPGGMAIGGVPLDLRSISIPAYFVSATADHIAPWKTTYIGAQLLSGPVKFVLGKAGHVAGVINPPHGKQYGYYTGPEIADLTAEQWFDQAVAREESWWPDWARWIKRYAGKQVPARVPGDGHLAVIEDAPGSYATKQYP